MKNWKRILIGALSLGVAINSFPTALHAAGEEYTYTVRFYAGNHGTFADTGCVEVNNTASGSSYRITSDGDTIQVSGLKAGDRISCDAAASGAMSLEEGDKYYVKGVRLSGADNSTVGMSSFLVEGDADYVAAYGILGDQTSYTVNYQDENGATLYESATYYGNVGDRPVVAFRYIDGYEPKAYNLTKTLVSNEAENVFTFTYKKLATDGGTTSTTTKTKTVTNNVTTTYVTEDGQTVAAGTENGTGSAGTGGTGAAGGGTTSNGTENGTEGTDASAETVEAVEEEEAPRELIDLDEEEAPRANLDLGGAEEAVTQSSHTVMIVIGVIAVILLGFLAFLFAKKRKEAEEK
jgi:hypothetical protein